MPQRLTEKELKTMNVWVFDIESTGLNAGFGWPLCTSFVPLFAAKRQNVKTFRLDNYERYSEAPWDDRPLVKDIVDFQKDIEVLVSHNGVWFDVQMLNTWAVLQQKWMNLDTKHIDTYRWARKQMRNGGRSLDALLTYFQTKTQKTKLKPLEWRKAATGDKESFEYIVKHNIHDVLSLAQMVRKILKATWLPYCYVR